MRCVSTVDSAGALTAGAALALTMLIPTSASAQNGVFIPDVQLEAPAELQPSLDECTGECEEGTRLRLAVDLDLDVDLDVRVELSELLNSLPAPPKRRYAVPLLVMAVGIGSMAGGVALLSDENAVGSSTTTRVGSMFLAVGGVAFMGGMMALLLRVLIFHSRRAERRRALLDAGLVRW
ncbi:MAG: hypothetical protein AAF938_11690 [Myxococcota bacterium]